MFYGLPPSARITHFIGSFCTWEALILSNQRAIIPQKQ